MLDRLIRLWQGNPLLVTAAGAAVAVVVLVVVVVVLRRLVRALAAAVARRRGEDPTSGAPLFYVVACMSTGVSVNTSWRFFGERLHITDVPERVVMFAVLEAAFVACAYGMRANVRQPDGQPGAPRAVAWMLTVLSAYMAIAESDFWEGIARVALGPVLGIVALHLALGVEIRHASPSASTGWAQLVKEMRERVLSRFGLANDDRDAATRTRHRAAVRAARLAAAEGGRFRQQRLARAVRVAGVAYDQDARERMLAELAALKSLDALTKLTPPSPWEPATGNARPRSGNGVARGATRVDAFRTAGGVDEASTVSNDEQRPTVQPVVVHGGVQPSGPSASGDRPMPSSARSARWLPLPVGTDGEHEASPHAGALAKDRARAAARRHAAAHGGQLPTVSELMALAGTSRGTAGNALKELREQPGQLQIVHDIEQASTQS
ncbi:hypothetical protein ACFFS4_16225 [Kutzneria kofuensis]|uniref:Uncharacterized protein n=2 Tax=Kutzneria kofuensis TaxID=103725 RepID=A0A7W9NHD3_9PSEU|nr:hypothetical protein [Kutzneria kofuensis]MBB5892625.1 hypothetical protein [Kutzneria kofuensis]